MQVKADLQTRNQGQKRQISLEENQDKQIDDVNMYDLNVLDIETP